MSIDNSAKEYCAHNLVAMVIDNLCSEYKDQNPDYWMIKLTRTKVYSKLFDFETGLWAEGPDYITTLFKREIKLI